MSLKIVDLTGCSIEVQGKSLKMPMFPTPSFQPGELLKRMYALFCVFQKDIT